MIKLFKKGSKQTRGSRTNRGKKNKNDSPAENFSLNPEDNRWLRIFKRAMGNETFTDFRNKIGKSSSPVECESVFEEFSEHLKWISIPDRESCTPEQVNKDLTRDKLIVNSREFVDHTRGTASQGLIKHLRNGVRAVICDALRSTYLSMAPDRAQRELDATLEWILQACTRTSHGADSFFAVHSLFGSAKPKSSLRPSMPMWLITPAQNATSQDSEVFVASGSDNKPFVFVCNFNDYCVQRRDHAMIRNSKDHGGNRLPMLLRTVVVEALDPSSITTAHASGSGVSSRLRGARVLCIASNRDYRNIRRRRLFRNMKRRAIRAHRLRKIRTAFEDWRVATAISRYGTVERVRARAELEHSVESSKVEVERKKAEVASVKKEYEGLVRTLEGLRGDVDVIETQVQDAALRNADLESDLDERLRKLEKMRQSIFRLKEQRLRSPAIRRNGVVTNLQTPRDMMRSRIFAVATERPQQQVVAGGEGEASEDVPLSIICTKRTAAKILRRRTDNPRGRRNGGGGGGNLIARERTHSDFERLVQDVTSTSTTTPKRERGKCPEHFSVVSRRSRRRRNRQHQQDSARKRTHLGASKRAFRLMFDRHSVQHAGRPKCLEKSDWVACMRSTGIVPHLLTQQTALVVFSQFRHVRSIAPRNSISSSISSSSSSSRDMIVGSMKLRPFVDAMTYIANVVYDVDSTRCLLSHICAVGYKKEPSALLFALRALTTSSSPIVARRGAGMDRRRIGDAMWSARSRN